ncbi:MAG: hypothetical protein V2I43_25775, partial [Parvularcula sp.]|nr:hypothetical protein [Parvularcula sp.]
MKVVFVSMCKKPAERMHLDPSVVYRCVNIARQLRVRGHDVQLFHADALPDRVAADVVILHRPRASRAFSRIRRRLAGTLQVCDFDDLLFDSSAVDEHPAYLSGVASRTRILEDTERYREALTSVGRSFISTPELREAFGRVEPALHGYVVRNGWDESWRAVGEMCPAAEV